MKKFICDLLSGTNGEHFELARVSLAIAVLTLTFTQIYALFKGQTFDPSALGIGFATVIGGGGAGIALKDRARTDADINGSGS